MSLKAKMACIKKDSQGLWNPARPVVSLQTIDRPEGRVRNLKVAQPARPQGRATRKTHIVSGWLSFGLPHLALAWWGFCLALSRFVGEDGTSPYFRYINKK